jgi:hypothetical protein
MQHALVQGQLQGLLVMTMWLLLDVGFFTLRFLLDLHRFTTKQSTFMMHKVAKKLLKGSILLFV